MVQYILDSQWTSRFDPFEPFEHERDKIELSIHFLHFVAG